MVNGLFATAVHFCVLVTGLEVMGLASAGVANLLAACCGIAVSFMGNRWFVFGTHGGGVVGQAGRFMLLYGVIALAHGAVLWAWTDVAGLDYRLGFMFATLGQLTFSYMGNERLVFK